MDNGKFIEPEQSIKSYFKDLVKYKSLSKKEERELLIDYKINNNIQARNKLINANLKYACKIATLFVGRGISYPDIISEANNGLMKGIEKYDLSKDVKLITYSKWWIIQQIQSAIDKKSKLNETDFIFNEEYTNDIDSENDSVSATTEYDDSVIVEDIFYEEKADDRELVISLLSCLNGREEDIMKMYYGVDYDKEYTLEEIGNKHGLTKERIKKILLTCFKKVRTEAVLNDIQYL